MDRTCFRRDFQIFSLASSICSTSSSFWGVRNCRVWILLVDRLWSLTGRWDVGEEKPENASQRHIVKQTADKSSTKREEVILEHMYV
jgi:hypothetical protein